MKRRIPTVCPYCAVGCGLYVVVEENGGPARARIDYMTEHPATHGKLCPKGNAALEHVHHPDRLTQPLKRVTGANGRGQFERISWDEAIGEVAARLRGVLAKHGPDAVGFISSSQCTNEENYLMQKLARCFGTNNIDNCARLCQTPSIHALKRAVGLGTMCTNMNDLLNARLMLFIGANPAESHPVLFNFPLMAKRKGATLIFADPRRTISVDFADIHVPLKPGTDLGFLLALTNIVVTDGLVNREFIASQTEGAEAVIESVGEYTPERMAPIVGVSPELLRRVAHLYAESPAAAILVGQGVTEHRTATATVSAAANLALLCGQYGRPGTGVSPLRGQSNVQGACDMGALAEFYPGYKALPLADAAPFESAWGLSPLPREIGLTNVELCHAAAAGKTKAMYIMGENCFVSLPNTSQIGEVRKNLDFLVVQDAFLSETAREADIVLPAALWAEKEGSCTSTERRVQWRHKAFDPPGEALPDWRILCSVAKALGFEAQFRFDGPEDVLREASRLIAPYRGITPERLKAIPGGIQWPCPSEDHPGTPVLYQDGFHTPDRKAHLFPVAYEPPAEEPDSDYPFMLTSARTVSLYNTSTMTSRSPSLARRFAYAEGYVDIHPADARRLRIREGDTVRLQSRRGETTVRAKITDRVPAGVLHAPYHAGGINRLTLDVLDPVSKTPEYKVCAVRLERVG